MTTRWEYLGVKWSAKVWHQTRTYVLRITYPSGEKARSESNDEGCYLSLLNQLGQEGWELVIYQVDSTAMFAGRQNFGVNEVASAVSGAAIFKRPIDEEDPH